MSNPKRTTKESSPVAVEEEGHGPRLNEMSLKFIADCIDEKQRLSEEFPVAAMLLDEAIERIYATGRIPGREMYADVFKQKIMKVTQKVFVPVRQFPKFNFQGKILGPRGNSLRSLQKETLCRIMIKGRHSMRDSNKEEELRQSGEPQHNHLHKDLYVEISTIARPAEAHARIAYALAEIRKYLIPDSNDEVSQNQRKEILADPELSKKARKTFVGDRGGDHDQIALSILKKIHTFSGNGGGEREHEEEEEPRSAPIRPPMKRNLAESSWSEPNPYFKRRSDEQGTSTGASRQSILKKFGYQSREQELDDDFEIEEEEMGRMSKRPMPQRYAHDEPSYMDRKYDTQQKRPREGYSQFRNASPTQFRNASNYGPGRSY